MTVAVAGCWELGYSAPLTERDLWLYPLRDFQVDRWIMAPVSGIRDQLLEEVDRLTDTDFGLPRVFVDETGAVELQDFEHPDEAVYIFGKAGFSPHPSMAHNGDHTVRIVTPERRGMLWPHQAAAVVLYDRQVKSWR